MREFNAAALATIGGYLITGTLLFLARRAIFGKETHWSNSLKMMDLWVGSVERLTAMVIFAHAPKYIAAFIGGWVALKFAANWQRKPTKTDESLIALTGSVISMAIALLAGNILNPNAAATFGRIANGP
jgi:hypothetical protein